MRELDEPPRNEDGEVTPHDHDGILGEDRIIRRVAREWVVEKRGKKCLSSIAYSPSSGPAGGMSVDVYELIASDGLDPVEYIKDPKHIGAVIIPVSGVRGLGFNVGYHPMDGKKYHSEVWGGFSRGNKRKMSEMAEWFVEIPGVASAMG